MLDLTKDESRHVYLLENESDNSIMLLREIVTMLINVENKAKIMCDKEIQYLTSVALESAKEKLILHIYENS